MFKIPRPPAEPLDPDDPRVEWMGEAYAPFECDDCYYFRGYGKTCRWVNKPLKEGDCCRRFLPPELKHLVGK